MSHNFEDLEKITQEEYNQLEKSFSNVPSATLAYFGWANDDKTVIDFYAYKVKYSNPDIIKIISLDGKFDIKCEQDGRDGGVCGTIRKKGRV